MDKKAALKVLIESDPANAARSDVEVLAWCNQTIEVPSAELVRARRLMAELTIVEARAVFVTLEAAAANDALVAEGLTQIRGDGIDLSHENARKMIDALFGENAEHPDLASKLKGMGRRVVTRWESIGLWAGEDEPTRLQMIAEARGNG